MAEPYLFRWDRMRDRCFGYRRIHDLLRREGVQAKHKKVYRPYREAALSVRKRRRRKLVMVDRQALYVAFPGL